MIWACSNAIIPNTVTIIGEGAFSYYTNLTSIIIPASVTTIEEYAFAGCSNLESVTFANNSQLITIERCAFSECTGLTSITIPASVTSIGNFAFDGCSETLTITMEDTTSFWARTKDIENPDWGGGFTHTQIAEELLTNPVYYWTKSTD